MYKTMLISSNADTQKIFGGMKNIGKSVNYWLNSVCTSSETAFEELQSGNYSLVIVDKIIQGENVETFLRTIKNRRYCKYIVIYSSEPDIEFARLGIVIGVCDYIFGKPDKARFYQIFNRINTDTLTGESLFIYEAEQLTECFKSNRNNFHSALESSVQRLKDFSENETVLAGNLYRLYQSIIESLFDDNDWLNNFLEKEKLYVKGAQSSEEHIRNISVLFEEYNRLFPKTEDETLRSVLIHILNNPDSDLRLKTLADKFWINNTYLSTFFKSNLNINFADYITLVKLKRAAFMLSSTKLTVNDISVRLGYSQPWYFSGLFKKMYGKTPSEYRKNG